MRGDPMLDGLRVHGFEYSSPKLRLPLSPVRVPSYDEIAQYLPGYLKRISGAGGQGTVIVTHARAG
jgi:hypothetical protein